MKPYNLFVLQDQKTPLLLVLKSAVENNIDNSENDIDNSDIVKMLLEKGADVNVKDEVSYIDTTQYCTS